MPIEHIRHLAVVVAKENVFKAALNVTDIPKIVSNHSETFFIPHINPSPNTPPFISPT